MCVIDVLVDSLSSLPIMVVCHAHRIGDRKLIDAARINLGMSRGNLTIPSYMDVVTTDLGALLKWKTRRVNFKPTS
jgi:hypothetical protein